jgi:1-aminocyclopropane-1-carboxylate deaminase/D-cysteine desulfhydrase-like pyridoxal-dependent ACC family enzyme
MSTALATLMSLPAAAFVSDPSPVARLARLERALGPGAPRIFIKRDDLLPFAQGGNKVRKLQMLVPEMMRAGTDTIVTCGAVQSNHARVTAAVGAVLGWKTILVLSGTPPPEPTGNLRYDYLFGADVRFVADREERSTAMEAAAEETRQLGRRPFVLPLGGSTPLGAAGMARGIAELATAGIRPTVIVHASSSAGTQAGLVAGCALFGQPARVIGVSADEPAAVLIERISALLDRLAALLGCRPDTLRGARPIAVDDTEVGAGYSQPTAASLAATTLVARTEGIVLDQVYTAKAMAGLIAHVRQGRFQPEDTILFWHTGGLL